MDTHERSCPEDVPRKLFILNILKKKTRKSDTSLQGLAKGVPPPKLSYIS